MHVMSALGAHLRHVRRIAFHVRSTSPKLASILASQIATTRSASHWLWPHRSSQHPSGVRMQPDPHETHINPGSSSASCTPARIDPISSSSVLPSRFSFRSPADDDGGHCGGGGAGGAAVNNRQITFLRSVVYSLVLTRVRVDLNSIEGF